MDAGTWVILLSIPPALVALAALVRAAAEFVLAPQLEIAKVDVTPEKTGPSRIRVITAVGGSETEVRDRLSAAPRQPLISYAIAIRLHVSGNSWPTARRVVAQGDLDFRTHTSAFGTGFSSVFQPDRFPRTIRWGDTERFDLTLRFDFRSIPPPGFSAWALVSVIGSRGPGAATMIEIPFINGEPSQWEASPIRPARQAMAYARFAATLSHSPLKTRTRKLQKALKKRTRYYELVERRRTLLRQPWRSP